MTNGIVSDLKQQFMNDKRLYDSLAQAIRLAKAYECTAKQMKSLVVLKQQYKRMQSNDTAKLLRAMPLSSNILQLEDNWHAIRYVTEKGDANLKIDIISLDEVYLLQRDGRHEPELVRGTLNDLLPAIIDEEGLDVYKAQLQVKAKQLVEEHIGLVSGEPEVDEKVEEPYEEWADIDVVPCEDTIADETYEDEQPVSVSSHAGLRWIQRIMGVKNEVQAEDHRKRNINAINDAVLDAFGLADKVWEDDGVSYWFNKDNVMFVVGTMSGYPNIVTLYEEDFGFTKEINRMIALKQLEVLSDVMSELTYYNDTADNVITQVEYGVQGINDNIKALESQIALLTSNRAVLMAEREQALKGVKASKDRYVAEFNKLFKKWAD